MSKKDEALKLALGKIKSARDCHFAAIDTLLFEAEEILEQALAEQPTQQEPVAYIEHHKAGDNLVWDNPGANSSPLYTSPPAQSKPLTDEEIMDLCRSLPTTQYTTAFARAIEAAHGIKENT